MDGTARAAARKTGDYPGVAQAFLDVARSYSSPLLLGPPLCDELLALIEHMFSEEEAEVARHIKPWMPRTAASLARASGRPLPEVKEVLHRLAHEKYVLISLGEGDGERFVMLPILPGTFEHVLVCRSPDSVTPWHRRFAELYEALYDTGFATQYNRKPVGAVRYIPVGEAISSLPMALPSERLDMIVERYDDFAIGVCQCRLSRQLVGEGCGKMLETCTVMGEFAPALVKEGRMRQASRRDVLEVKAAAEKEGLVTWMMADDGTKSFRCSCSCCGCCCGALRQVTQFNSPGFVAPPHFMPRIDLAACAFCGKCARVCPLEAMEVCGEGEGKIRIHRAERCIGCGLCVVACDKGALTMREVPDFREPPGSFLSYILRNGRNYVANSFKVWRERCRA